MKWKTKHESREPRGSRSLDQLESRDSSVSRISAPFRDRTLTIHREAETIPTIHAEASEETIEVSTREGEDPEIYNQAQSRKSKFPLFSRKGGQSSKQQDTTEAPTSGNNTGSKVKSKSKFPKILNRMTIGRSKEDQEASRMTMGRSKQDDEAKRINPQSVEQSAPSTHSNNSSQHEKLTLYTLPLNDEVEESERNEPAAKDEDDRNEPAATSTNDRNEREAKGQDDNRLEALAGVDWGNIFKSRNYNFVNTKRDETCPEILKARQHLKSTFDLLKKASGLIKVDQVEVERLTKKANSCAKKARYLVNKIASEDDGNPVTRARSWSMWSTGSGESDSPAEVKAQKEESFFPFGNLNWNIFVKPEAATVVEDTEFLALETMRILAEVAEEIGFSPDDPALCEKVTSPSSASTNNQISDDPKSEKCGNGTEEQIPTVSSPRNLETISVQAEKKSHSTMNSKEEKVSDQILKTAAEGGKRTPSPKISMSENEKDRPGPLVKENTNKPSSRSKVEDSSTASQSGLSISGRIRDHLSSLKKFPKDSVISNYEGCKTSTPEEQKVTRNAVSKVDEAVKKSDESKASYVDSLLHKGKKKVDDGSSLEPKTEVTKKEKSNKSKTPNSKTKSKKKTTDRGSPELKAASRKNEKAISSQPVKQKTPSSQKQSKKINDGASLELKAESANKRLSPSLTNKKKDKDKATSELKTSITKKDKISSLPNKMVSNRASPKLSTDTTKNEKASGVANNRKVTDEISMTESTKKEKSYGQSKPKRERETNQQKEESVLKSSEKSNYLSNQPTKGNAEKDSSGKVKSNPPANLQNQSSSNDKARADTPSRFVLSDDHLSQQRKNEKKLEPYYNLSISKLHGDVGSLASSIDSMVAEWVGRKEEIDDLPGTVEFLDHVSMKKRHGEPDGKKPQAKSVDLGTVRSPRNPRSPKALKSPKSARASRSPRSQKIVTSPRSPKTLKSPRSPHGLKSPRSPKSQRSARSPRSPRSPTSRKARTNGNDSPASWFGIFQQNAFFPENDKDHEDSSFDSVSSSGESRSSSSTGSSKVSDVSFDEYVLSGSTENSEDESMGFLSNSTSSGSAHERRSMGTMTRLETMSPGTSTSYGDESDEGRTLHENTSLETPIYSNSHESSEQSNSEDSYSD